MERLGAPIPRDAEPTTPEQLELRELIDRLFTESDRWVVFLYNKHNEVQDGWS